MRSVDSGRHNYPQGLAHSLRVTDCGEGVCYTPLQFRNFIISHRWIDAAQIQKAAVFRTELLIDGVYSCALS